MLRMALLHRSPLYKISKNVYLEKNDYETQKFVKLKNAQNIKELYSEY